jgi:uncharacterized small protein (DUF1192 family)
MLEGKEMVDSNHKRNTVGIERFRMEKQQECRKRVDQVINELIRNHKAINFNTVGEEAGVSKKYLYDHYYERIDNLRRMQKDIKPKQVKHQMTDSNKDVLLVAKNKRIKELEAEVERLKGILQRKYSDEYNNI